MRYNDIIEGLDEPSDDELFGGLGYMTDKVAKLLTQDLIDNGIIDAWATGRFGSMRQREYVLEFLDYVQDSIQGLPAFLETLTTDRAEREFVNKVLARATAMAQQHDLNETDETDAELFGAEGGSVRDRLHKRLNAAYRKIIDEADDWGFEAMMKYAKTYSKLFDKWDDGEHDPNEVIAYKEPVQIVSRVVAELERIAEDVNEYLDENTESDLELFGNPIHKKIGKWLSNYAIRMIQEPDEWAAFSPDDGDEYERDIEEVREQGEILHWVAQVFATQGLEEGLQEFTTHANNYDNWWWDRIAPELNQETGISLEDMANDAGIQESAEGDDELFGKKWYENIDMSSIELDGIDRRDAPDFTDAYINYAETKDGQILDDEQLDILTDIMSQNGTLHELVYNSLYESAEDDELFGDDDRELFGGKSVYKTVQKLLQRGATVEMRHMGGRPMKVTGALDVDGHPYMFGMSLTNPKTRARLSHPWSENSDRSTRVVEVGPNHYAIVKRSTLTRRGNKYVGMPTLAETDDDELFGGKKETGRYWYNKPAYFSDLWSQLVPQSGHSQYVEGELFRAATRIYYDYYNNGFGNNWVGALNFIKQTMGRAPGLAVLTPYASGRMPKGQAKEEQVEVALDQMMDAVLRVIHQARGQYKPNDTDMNSLREDNDLSDEELFGEKRVWKLYIWMNRWDGRYYDYQPYPIFIPGVTGQDAVNWVLRNQERVLQWLDSIKLAGSRPRRLVRRPAAKNVFFNNIRIDKVTEPGTMPSRVVDPKYAIQ